MNLLILFSFFLSICARYLDTYNIEVDRLLCTENAICNSIKTAMEGKTIRDICINSVGKIAIDSEFIVYFHSVPNGAKKVACTSTGYLVLMFDGKVYHKEGAANFEVISENVKDINAHDDFFLLTLTNNKIMMGGTNFTGNEIIGLNEIVVEGLTSDTESLKITPIDKGILFSFENQHFFMGKDHPTDFTLPNNFAVSPIKLDFSIGSQLDENDPIDFIGRPKDGCTVIVSSDQFFVSGSNCADHYPLETPSLHPYLINKVTYGDFDQTNQRVIDFLCSGFACYILTEENILAFGKSSPIFIDPLQPLIKFKKVADPFFQNAISLIPSVGTPNDFFSFSKSAIIDTNNQLKKIEGNIVNQYPPTYNSANSGLFHSNLQIVIEKDEVFGQKECLITMGKETTSTVADFCFLKTKGDSSIWNLKNSDGTDFYSSNIPWSTHTAFCGWENDDTSDADYYIWRNRINFKEYFFLDYKQSFMQERIEEYEMDVLLRFKKTINLVAEINGERNDYGSEILVTEKEWNRNNMQGELWIQIKHDLGVLTESLQISNTILAIFSSVSITEDSKQIDCSDGLNCYQMFKLTYTMEQGECDPSTSFTFSGNLICNPTPEYFNHPNCIGIDEAKEDFSVDILGENVCAELQEDIELEGNILVYKDWAYKDLYDLDSSSSFTIDNYGYFIVDVSSSGNKASIVSSKIEKIEIETYLDIPINEYSVPKNRKTLYEEGVTTDLLVIDHNSQDLAWGITRTGFHTKFKQEYLQIEYGDQVTAKILVTVSVEYEGNNRRIIKMFRRSAPMHGTSSEASSRLSLEVKIDGEERKNFTFLVILTFVLCYAIFTGVFGFSMMLCGCCKRKINEDEINTQNVIEKKLSAKLTNGNPRKI